MGSPNRSDSDAELVARAVDQLTRATRFPVAFGGLEQGGAIHVTAVSGARTHHLDGLVVQSGRGLGGRAMIEKRPRLAIDYRSSRSITHDYDGPVLGEGISTLLAVPVMVGSRARGVVYCGSWTETPVADSAGAAFGIAGELGSELRVREEVERRVALAARDAAMPVRAREELRESYAELRRISAGIDDPDLRAQLAGLERRLAALSTEDTDPELALDVRLSPRETDVLACVALGATNAEVAATLGLKEMTVKSYLQSAMAKLDASTRHAAVAKARRAGILP